MVPFLYWSNVKPPRRPPASLNVSEPIWVAPTYLPPGEVACGLKPDSTLTRERTAPGATPRLSATSLTAISLSVMGPVSLLANAAAGDIGADIGAASEVRVGAI